MLFCNFQNLILVAHKLLHPWVRQDRQGPLHRQGQWGRWLLSRLWLLSRQRSRWVQWPQRGQQGQARR